MVGTRSPTPAAAEAARQLGFELAQRGFQVISGMAFGIDSAAHIGALAQPDGTTSAVLGSGVLNRYPPENRALAQAILQRGALISENHPHAQPKPSTLVARNRIISGLCEALIVVQTEVDGGAMHAARRAVEQGRRVYTLEDTASGNRALINFGATIITPDLVGFSYGSLIPPFTVPHLIAFIRVRSASPAKCPDHAGREQRAHVEGIPYRKGRETPLRGFRGIPEFSAEIIPDAARALDGLLAGDIDLHVGDRRLQVTFFAQRIGDRPAQQLDVACRSASASAASSLKNR